MTPEEALAKMQALADENNNDPEGFHGDADALLCELLRQLGYTAMVEFYDSQTKWYA